IVASRPVDSRRMRRLPLHVPPPSRVRNPDATGRRWLRRCIEAEAPRGGGRVPRARPPQVPRAPAAFGGTPRPTRRAWTEDRERAGHPRRRARPTSSPRRFRLQRRRNLFRLPAEQRREVGLLLLARRGLGAAHRALALDDRP